MKDDRAQQHNSRGSLYFTASNLHLDLFQTWESFGMADILRGWACELRGFQEIACLCLLCM